MCEQHKKINLFERTIYPIFDHFIPFLYPKEIVNILLCNKILHDNKIYWKKILRIMLHDSLIQFNVDFPNYHNMITNLCQTKCFMCDNSTTLFHVEMMVRICAKCFERETKETIEIIETRENIMPIIGNWFFKSTPDFIISNKLKPGKYNNHIVSPDLWTAIDGVEFGSVIHIMKDIVIDERFIDRQIVFRQPVHIIGLPNEDTGEKCKISLLKSTIVFNDSCILENLIIISGQEPYGNTISPHPVDAYPCIQIDRRDNNKKIYKNIIIRNCDIIARMGTGILIYSSDDIINIYNNIVTNCGYAGICFACPIPKLKNITNNNIIKNGSWAIQSDEDINNIKDKNYCSNNSTINFVDDY